MADFISQIAPLVQKYAPEYGVACNSAVIAQAVLESGYGESRLSKRYHNYFGLKCGTAWRGKSVNMLTQEEYRQNVMETIADNFRVYDSMEDGVKGYFEFIQLPRYQNLKGIKDPKVYLETIRADGYATDYRYVSKCMEIVDREALRQYDGGDTGVTAEDVLNVFRSWLGGGSHKTIVDIYNSHTPLAQGYRLSYDDSWCDATVSAVFIKLGAVDLIGGTECGVERHIQLFKAAGIWNEDGNARLKPGDIICFNWDDSTQPNDGFADHIGIVESVNGDRITTIEGNYNNAVQRRVLEIGNGYIRGYARPRYAEGHKKPVEPVVTTAPSKKPQCTGRVTADALNVRTWAGTEHPTIKSYPLLTEGNLVDVCDTVEASDGSDWYYVRIAGQWYGFVLAKYIEIV